VIGKVNDLDLLEGQRQHQGQSEFIWGWLLKGKVLPSNKFIC